jgi:hypothetical protein
MIEIDKQKVDKLVQNKDKRLLDKEWRMSHLYKIKNKAGERVTFKKNRVQEHFEKNKHTFNIMVKSRQHGVTTYEAIDMLDDTLFNRNFEALFIAHTKEDAIKIFDNKVKFAWDNFPLQKLYSIDANRSNELKVNFGDKTFSYITVANSGRSGTYRRVHISEFAKLCKMYPERASEIISGTIPALPMGARCDIEGTAEGENGLFADMFWEAWNRGEPEYPNQFKAHFYGWLWDDEQIARVEDTQIESFLKSEDFKTFDDYRKELKEKRKTDINDKELTYYYMKWISLNRNWQILRQEFPTTPEEAFVGSGNKLFDQDKIARLQPKEGKKEGDWLIYEDYNRLGMYVMGADVAEGVGQDSSTAAILDIHKIPYQVVVTFKNNNIEPDQFAYELDKFGRRYGTCLIAPEINSIGHTTVSKLKEIYPNVYKEVDGRKAFETKSKFVKSIKTLKYGWRTTGASKPIMLYDLNEAINNEEIEVNDKTIITELRTYDRENISQIRFDEKQTKHWDMVMALAIAYQLRTKIVRGKTRSYAIPR